MLLRYDVEAARVIISFDPNESHGCSVLMQLVWEEEWYKGTTVPNLKEAFFKRIALAKERVSITFDYEYVEFVINFLKAACEEQRNNGVNIAPIEDFIHKVSGYCPVGQTIH